jgi:hypothetical protein
MRRCIAHECTVALVVLLVVVFALDGPTGAAAACVPAPAPTSEAANTSPGSAEPPLYSMGDEIFTVDHDGTAYYYFRGSRNGSAKAKRELRYDHNLWNTCAQLQVRVPFITRYPNAPNAKSPDGDPYTGFGNAELRYSYNVVAPKFDHSLEIAAAFPTETNGVESTDTVLKLLYATRWKWDGGAIAYANEYDQSLIRPPGSYYTSYYEGKLTFPNWTFSPLPELRGLKLSAFYVYRVLFATGGAYKSAAGAVLGGNINDVAVGIVDSWGIGPNGLWKYKFEASAVVRF